MGIGCLAWKRMGDLAEIVDLVLIKPWSHWFDCSGWTLTWFSKQHSCSTLVCSNIRGL